MTDNRNRGSPRLQFTKEELENDALSRPIEKAEKAADRYDAARKKLKKHYRLKLNRAETDENSPQPSRTERGNTEPSASEARNTAGPTKSSGVPQRAAGVFAIIN